MNQTAIIVIFFVVVIAIWWVVDYVVNSAANKAGDAFQNAMAKRHNEKNPPKQESLADRYGASVSVVETKNEPKQMEE